MQHLNLLAARGDQGRLALPVAHKAQFQSLRHEVIPRV